MRRRRVPCDVLMIVDRGELYLIFRGSLYPFYDRQQTVPALCGVPSSVPGLNAIAEGTLRFPCVHHPLLQACSRSASTIMYDQPRRLARTIANVQQGSSS